MVRGWDKRLSPVAENADTENGSVDFLSSSYTGSLAQRGSVSLRLSDLGVTKHLLPAFRRPDRQKQWGVGAANQAKSLGVTVRGRETEALENALRACVR